MSAIANLMCLFVSYRIALYDLYIFKHESWLISEADMLVLKELK